MTEAHNNDDQFMVSHESTKRKKPRRVIVVIGSVLLLLILLFVVALVLLLTVFKTNDPTTQLVSATLDGVASTVSLPAVQLRLNLTLDLKILIHNPNYASFKHGQGRSDLYYRDNKVGETDIYAGLVPAKGSATLACRLTLQVEKLASDVDALIGDIMDGQLSLDSFTRLPGRVSFFGIFKKHVLALSECHFTFGIPDMKVRSQTCKSTTKL
ncbi:Late embryogenesis abundant protein [Senna tora]|uniref:Late embryogenesis abundant protein n=1 Tax=Senna tora TaxID=362788 RepID=A0A834WN32_9FABA|nr:Late embryogenesis abundant protein [Senna tora]